jgi:hypothetical protein
MVTTRSGRVLSGTPARRSRTITAQYGPDDDCKRHRKPDRKPKDVVVVTHRRRKPN